MLAWLLILTVPLTGSLTLVGFLNFSEPRVFFSVKWGQHLRHGVVMKIELVIWHALRDASIQ